MNNIEKLQNHFRDLKKDLSEIIHKADTICDLKERTEYFYENADEIQKALKALETSNLIHFVIMHRILAKEFEYSPVPLITFRPSKDNCQILKKNEAEINNELAAFNFLRAEKLYEYVKSGKKTKRYTDRHRLAESAIALVWELFDANETWSYTNIVSEKDACSFIAECYLLRSKLALQKGSDIPEKKLEALKKAWKWAEKGNKETDDLKIRIALETERWDNTLEKGWIRQYLDDFLENNKFEIYNPLHWIINDRACEFNLSLNKDDSIVKYPVTDASKEKYIFPLYQAKAAFRSGMSDIDKKLEKAVDRLNNLPLSDSLWNDTVDLIEKVKDKNLTGWETAAIKAWEKCQEAEERIKLSVQVRWYWSKYRNLYNLAFHAAIIQNDPLLALKIADSLKSRPTMKMQYMESSLKGDDREIYKKIIEADATFFASGYHPEIKLKNITVTKTELRDFQNIPDGWAAVHFFVISKDEAYSLIVENKNCQHVRIENIADLWNAFQEWNNDRKNFSVKNSTASLKRLCQQSGRMLEPILRDIHSKGIIFIPHGFLHLVPLHAAIVEDNKYLFQEKYSVFLPSWSMAPYEDSQPVNAQNDILLTNWHDCNDIKELIIQDDWHNSYVTENSAEEFFNELDGLGHPPELLVLFSHGQGDFINPYLSRFVMNKSSLTHQAILQNAPGLSGAKVILTACESDLVSDSSGPTDEHLSLATAFLRKGADEVIGALFTCFEDVSQELVLAAKANSDKPLYQILKEKQTEWASTKMFYKVPAFRVMGFPVS